MDNGDKVFELIKDALDRIEDKVDNLAPLPGRVSGHAKAIAWLYRILGIVVAGLVLAFIRGN